MTCDKGGGAEYGVVRLLSKCQVLRITDLEVKVF